MQEFVKQIDLDQLPSLPQVLLKILRELNTDNLNVNELARLISQDATVSLKLLAVANSSTYRRHTYITSIEQSINLLGLKMVKTIAISISIQQFLNNISGIVPVNFDQFWQHSQATAFLSRRIAEAINYPNAEEAYLAGMFHDVGKLALLVTNTEIYKDIFQQYPDSDTNMEEEESLLGINHCEIGAQLAEHWNLEPLIVEAIRYHHEPLSRVENAAELVKIVLLANALSKMGKDGRHHPALAAARALFDINAGDALEFTIDAKTSVIELATNLGVNIHTNTRQSTDSKSAFLESHDLIIQKQLIEEVRSATMLSLAHEALDLSVNDKELLGHILNTALILFKPQHVFFFEWDANTNLLTGRPLTGQPESLSRIRFASESGRSLISNALLWDKLAHSFDEEAVVIDSMLDQQILRLAESDGMYCAPMVSDAFVFGVLVIVFPPNIGKTQLVKTGFFTQFSRLAARQIAQVRLTQQVKVSERSGDQVGFYQHAQQVIHEVSNPLSIMKNYLKVLDMKLGQGETAGIEIQILNEEIDRVTSTIRKLIEVPSVEVRNYAAIDVNGVIADVLSICEPSLFKPANIEVQSLLDQGLVQIYADQNSLKQVLVNLFKNAAEAMTEGGRLVVATAMVINAHQLHSISITISDNGPGIPKNILNKLFSPVKSLKGGDNAGIGLSISSALVAELGGTISCKSAALIGTSFEIVLPVVQSSNAESIKNAISYQIPETN